MVIFDGKKISDVILGEVSREVSSLKEKPKLAIIKIGENPEIDLYISNKERAANKVGIELIKKEFPENVDKGDVLKTINDFNRDNSVDGIIVQLPLPENLNPTEIISMIIPEKDVDGFHPQNRMLLKEGKTNFLSPLASAISIALQEAQKISLSDGIIALVKSDIFSETLSDFLKIQGFRIKTLTFSNMRESFIKGEMSKADIIISVLGEPGFIKKDFLKKGVAIIDAGIRVIGGKVMGDLDKKDISRVASFITPVPGGIGPLVVALLLNNVFLLPQKT